jgi:hypothetical protein
MAYKSQPTVTRPANTTAYAAGDVVGGVICFGAHQGHFLLTTGDLRINVAAVPSGMTSFRLYLYKDAPPSNLADNAPWTLLTGDRASFVAYVDLGSPAAIGGTLFTQVDGINKHIALNGSTLCGYLVTNGAFTPAGNSEEYVPCLRGVDL